MKMRRRPSMSAARPPRISSPLNAMAYPVTTHCTTEVDTPKSRSIDGSAIFTMVKSSTTINDATRINASRRPDRAVVLVNISLIVGRDGGGIRDGCAFCGHDTNQVRGGWRAETS